MNLKEFQKKYHIRRIDFEKVEPSGFEEEYASDKLICPYCKSSIDYDCEDANDMLSGTPFLCPECEKWFYASGEVSIDTTCTPIEDKVIERRSHIKSDYQYMDDWNEKGCEWDNPWGVVEYETYKEYAEPLFKNLEDQHEVRRSRKDRKE